MSHSVEFRVDEVLEQSRPESIEFFFLERNLLFLERQGVIYTGQVHHTPYPVHRAKVIALQDDLLSAAECGCCEGAPEFAHFSPGVDVEIFVLEKQQMNQSR